MGSGESRFQQRRNDIDDLNTVGINYVGGHGYKLIEFDPVCPIDKIVLACCAGKEPSAEYQIDTNELKATNEKNMHNQFIAVLCSLILKRIRLQQKFSIVYDPKAVLTGEKYHRDDANWQICRSIRALSELSGFKGAEEIEKECEEAMNKKKEEKDKKKLEEQEKGIKPQHKKKPKIILKKKDEDDTRPDYEPEDNIDEFRGWSNFPQLCLKIVGENPFLFDSVKCETLRWEFRQKDKKKKFKKEKYMGNLAGLISELVRSGQAASKEEEKIWLSGVLGPNDIQGLMELYRKEDRNLQDKKKVEFRDPEKSVIDGKDMEAESKENDQPEGEMEMEGGGEENSQPEGMMGESVVADKEGEEKKDEMMMEEDAKVVDEKIIHKILIPGVSKAYASQEEAVAAINFNCQSKQENVQFVLFEVDNARCFTGPKNTKYIQRLFCSLMTHQIIKLKQSSSDEDDEKKKEENPESKDSEDKEKKEISKTQEETQQTVHHFKMVAEPRDSLMPVQQWEEMKKKNAATDRKEVEVEEIDESDIPKATVMVTQTDGKADDDDVEPEGQKECVIF